MDPAPTRVLVFEEDPPLRERCAAIVSAAPGLQLLAATGSPFEARRRLLDGPAPDVLLLDPGRGSALGTGLIRLLQACAPRAAALVVSTCGDEACVLQALSAGARGYLLHEATADELVRAIREVHAGAAPLSPRVACHLLRQFAPAPRPRPARPAPAEVERLSRREAEVLSLVAGGDTASQVARKLVLSPHTVNTHLKNCYAKLATRNRLQAIDRARGSGQIA